MLKPSSATALVEDARFDERLTKPDGAGVDEPEVIAPRLSKNALDVDCADCIDAELDR